MRSFQVLGPDTIYLLMLNRNLWFATCPRYGPTTRRHVDGNVSTFQGLSEREACILGTDGKLWLASGPWERVPPTRLLITTGVRVLDGPSAQSSTPA